MCGGGVNIPIWGIPILLVIAGGQFVFKGTKSAANSIGSSIQDLREQKKKSQLQSTQLTNEINKTNQDGDIAELYVLRAFAYCDEDPNLSWAIDVVTSDLEAYFKLGGKRLDARMVLCAIYDAKFKFDLAIQHYTEAINGLGVHLEKGGSHEFKITTYKKPTYCLHCSKILMGIKNQGVTCQICSAITHKDCVSKFNIACQGRASKDEHNFVVKSFHYPRKCSQCSQVLQGLFKQGSQCLGCDIIAHEKCKSLLTEKCKKTKSSSTSLVTLSDLYGGRGLTYYHNSQYKEALLDIDKAIDLELNSNNTSHRIFAHYANRGFTNFYLNNLAESIIDFTKALEENQIKKAQIYSMRATCFQLLGCEKEAELDRYEAYILDNTYVLNVFPFPIPKDIVLEIFSHLKLVNLKNCCYTCKDWSKIVVEYHQWIKSKNVGVIKSDITSKSLTSRMMNFDRS